MNQIVRRKDLKRNIKRNGNTKNTRRIRSIRNIRRGRMTAAVTRMAVMMRKKKSLRGS